MSTSQTLLAEARRQLEDLMRGREVKLGLVAHKYFMPHLFRALPNTSTNPVTAAASAALNDINRRVSALRVERKPLSTTKSATRKTQRGRDRKKKLRDADLNIAELN